MLRQGPIEQGGDRQSNCGQYVAYFAASEAVRKHSAVIQLAN
jgi:hypothetical protein